MQIKSFFFILLKNNNVNNYFNITEKTTKNDSDFFEDLNMDNVEVTADSSNRKMYFKVD